MDIYCQHAQCSLLILSACSVLAADTVSMLSTSCWYCQHAHCSVLAADTVSMLMLSTCCWYCQHAHCSVLAADTVSMLVLAADTVSMLTAQYSRLILSACSLLSTRCWYCQHAHCSVLAADTVSVLSTRCWYCQRAQYSLLIWNQTVMTKVCYYQRSHIAFCRKLFHIDFTDDGIKIDIGRYFVMSSWLLLI